MPIFKSTGVTPTEQLLADLCERSFLKLWSWPNPFKDDGHEFCDLLAVFENHAFIFFDREKELVDLSGGSPEILWGRWKRNVIEAQVKTAHGAERYLRSGRAIYLDSKNEVAFPLSINLNNLIVHKIIVGHGAVEACKNFSTTNVNGSLAIVYGEGRHNLQFPFIIDLDRHNPVHVLDSHTLPVIMDELDTFSDFSRYMDAKITAITSLTTLAYASEEDLLAHYFLNFDTRSKSHFIGTNDPTINGVFIEEGQWADFVALPQYIETKKLNSKSFLWDDLIQKTAANRLNGTLGGNADLLLGRSAIHEMAREPRFMRRELAAKMLDSITRFPDTPDKMTRLVNLMPSYHQDTVYVFLQLWVPGLPRDDEYREKRRFMLEIACGAAKNRHPKLRNVVGIGIDAPKFTGRNAEDFVLMTCDEWPADRAKFYRDQNATLGFFQSPGMTSVERTVTEFVKPDQPKEH